MTLIADAFEVRPAGSAWRGALAVSLLLHGTLLLGALWLMQPRTIDEPDELAAIGVTIIEMQTASDAQAPTESDATAEMVAAGAASPQTVEPVETVVAEQTTAVDPLHPKSTPIESAALSPLTEPAPVTTEQIEAVEPEQARPMATSSVELAEPVSQPAVADATPDRAMAMVTDNAIAASQVIEIAATPAQTARAEPASVEPVMVATAQGIRPMAEWASAEPVQFETPVAEINRIEAVEPVEAVEPKPAPAKPKPPTGKAPEKTKPEPTKTAASPGDGGRSNANASASAAKASGGKAASEGGSAAVSRYPGEVQAALRRALQSQSGSRKGEVQVQFVIAANGAVSGIRVVKSSGNDALDAAALATVRRAAPFPPIPDDAGRNSWSFVLPLRFR